MMLKATDDVLLTATDDIKKLKGWAATEADLKRIAKGETEAANAILKELTEKEIKQLIANAAIRNRILTHFKDLKFYKQGDEFVVMYEGEKLFAHSHAPYTNSFVESVFKQPNAAKRLKKLKEFAAKRRVAFAKWAKKFEVKFHKHFDGELLTRERNGVEELIVEGAHNHTLHGNQINMSTIRHPPGVSSYANVPDNIPFKANVELLYSNRPILKQKTSTFFPKNWDIERV